jgi:hypothetical protein
MPDWSARLLTCTCEVTGILGWCFLTLVSSGEQ